MHITNKNIFISNEIFTNILSFLDPKSLGVSARICKVFCEVVYSIRSIEYKKDERVSTIGHFVESDGLSSFHASLHSRLASKFSQLPTMHAFEKNETEVGEPHYLWAASKTLACGLNISNPKLVHNGPGQLICFDLETEKATAFPISLQQIPFQICLQDEILFMAGPTQLIEYNLSSQSIQITNYPILDNITLTASSEWIAVSGNDQLYLFNRTNSEHNKTETVPCIRHMAFKNASLFYAFSELIGEDETDLEEKIYINEFPINPKSQRLLEKPLECYDVKIIAQTKLEGLIDPSAPQDLLLFLVKMAGQSMTTLKSLDFFGHFAIINPQHEKLLTINDLQKKQHCYDLSHESSDLTIALSKTAIFGFSDSGEILKWSFERSKDKN